MPMLSVRSSSSVGAKLSGDRANGEVMFSGAHLDGDAGTVARASRK